jgi:hypothetical protein
LQTPVPYLYCWEAILLALEWVAIRGVGSGQKPSGRHAQGTFRIKHGLLNRKHSTQVTSRLTLLLPHLHRHEGAVEAGIVHFVQPPACCSRGSRQTLASDTNNCGHRHGIPAGRVNMVDGRNATRSVSHRAVSTDPSRVTLAAQQKVTVPLHGAQCRTFGHDVFDRISAGRWAGSRTLRSTGRL